MGWTRVRLAQVSRRRCRWSVLKEAAAWICRAAGPRGDVGALLVPNQSQASLPVCADFTVAGDLTVNRQLLGELVAGVRLTTVLQIGGGRENLRHSEVVPPSTPPPRSSCSHAHTHAVCLHGATQQLRPGIPL